MTHTSLQLGTKAETLAQLQGVLRHATVLPLVRIPVVDYLANPEGWYHRVCDTLTSPLLAVRSSSTLEDTATSSMAGHFASVLNVPAADPDALHQAIGEVIASYGDLERHQEVLIQPMMTDVACSGVALTLDLDMLAPYYVIEYSTTGTDVVTGGKADTRRTYVCFKQSPVPAPEAWLDKLITACRELEALFQTDALDIEFGVTGQEEIVLFQVRPLAKAHGAPRPGKTLDLSVALEKLYKKIDKLSRPHPSMMGSHALFGVMPDWNPAEIIGIRPKPLALSLYKELITDQIWAIQREKYGYRDLKSHPLLVSFFGLPYIDIRVDFNSFIPEALDPKTAEKLADIYLEQLIESPQCHDKVEFEIVHSCYCLNTPERLGTLGLTSDEQQRFQQALLTLTNRIIQEDGGLFDQDVQAVQELPTRMQAVMDSELALVDKIYWLIEDCKRYGTLPFAGIARAAFVAVQLLSSFVAVGLFTPDDYQAFLNSLNTISKQLSADVHAWQSSVLSREEFVRRYGHLRPGTYDILSPRYDQSLDVYFPTALKSPILDPGTEEAPTPVTPFELTPDHRARINEHLHAHGFQFSVDHLLRFIREAIEAREASKFEFTKCLSQILESIAQLGERVGLSREDMAFVDVESIRKLYVSLTEDDVGTRLQADIRQARQHYQYTQALKLPSLIRKPQDVYSFYLDAERPTFVTQGVVEAPVVLEADLYNRDVTGCIVLIRSADPGYDFLFAKNIAGLVTQYGGANSHMAIRCAELGLPAVIGAGEALFNQWTTWDRLRIDGINQQVLPLYGTSAQPMVSASR